MESDGAPVLVRSPSCWRRLGWCQGVAALAVQQTCLKRVAEDAQLHENQQVSNTNSLLNLP